MDCMCAFFVHLRNPSIIMGNWGTDYNGDELFITIKVMMTNDG